LYSTAPYIQVRAWRTIICDPDQESIAFQARLHHICKPPVQYIMQVDIA